VSEVTFTYPSRVESEEQMLDDVTGVLDESGIVGDLKRNVLLVISEAFNNALIHGNSFDPAKGIVLRLVVNQTEVRADIIDEGQGGLERVRAHRSPDALDTHGRGIGLIRHYADLVDFREDDQGRLEVTVRFERNMRNQEV
jgi:anti-sigma regulatory factor (Ser/Thr protein kinase)